jgi:flagellar biosynthesis protein FlhG
VIAITSGKGGVGKTNTAVNLAVTLAACGLKASLVDADLGLANADVLCGITPTTRLDSVLNKSSPSRAANRGLDAIAIDAPGGFKLVPGAVGVRRMTSLAPSERVQLIESLDALDAASDVILVDTGAGISDGVTDFVQASDLAIVVLTPEPTSIADAYAIIKACFAPHLRRDDERSPVLSVIVNQARSRDEGLAVYQRLSNTCERFLGIRPILLGTLPIDPALPAAVRRRVPVCLASPSAPISHELGRVAGEVAKLCGLSTTKTRANPAPARRWWSKLLGRA